MTVQLEREITPELAAEFDDIAQWAAELSDKYLECRRYAHAWRPWTADYIRKERVFEEVARCSRCLTRRIELMSEWGEIVSRHYLYPDGYQHKGHGRITGVARGALRVERAQRTIEKRRQKG